MTDGSQSDATQAESARDELEALKRQRDQYSLAMDSATDPKVAIRLQRTLERIEDEIEGLEAKIESAAAQPSAGLAAQPGPEWDDEDDEPATAIYDPNQVREQLAALEAARAAEAAGDGSSSSDPSSPSSELTAEAKDEAPTSSGVRRKVSAHSSAPLFQDDTESSEAQVEGAVASPINDDVDTAPEGDAPEVAEVANADDASETEGVAGAGETSDAAENATAVEASGGDDVVEATVSDSAAPDVEGAEGPSEDSTTQRLPAEPDDSGEVSEQSASSEQPASQDDLDDELGTEIRPMPSFAAEDLPEPAAEPEPPADAKDFAEERADVASDANPLGPVWMDGLSPPTGKIRTADAETVVRPEPGTPALIEPEPASPEPEPESVAEAGPAPASPDVLGDDPFALPSQQATTNAPATAVPQSPFGPADPDLPFGVPAPASDLANPVSVFEDDFETSSWGWGAKFALLLVVGGFLAFAFYIMSIG